MDILKGFLGVVLISVCGYANATILQITATSLSIGELGWFAVDDAVLATDTSLVASQFVDFSFSDPLGSPLLTFNPTNVLADTGVTYFSLIAGEWTVTGGGADSLTNIYGNGIWIAGTSYLWFRPEDSYSDVTWSTTEFQSVPEPTTLALMGLGLAGIGFSRKKKES